MASSRGVSRAHSLRVAAVGILALIAGACAGPAPATPGASRGLPSSSQAGVSIPSLSVTGPSSAASLSAGSLSAGGSGAPSHTVAPSASATPSSSPPQASTSGCPPQAAEVTLQPGLPGTPPLPGGTRLTHATVSPGGAVLLAGIIPIDLRSAVLFFRNDFAAAGFVSEKGDAEQDEAEASFSGQGIQGRWKVHGILACPNAVTLELVFRPAVP